MYISNIEPRKTSADRGGLSTIHNLITKTRLLESIDYRPTYTDQDALLCDNQDALLCDIIHNPAA